LSKIFRIFYPNFVDGGYIVIFKFSVYLVNTAWKIKISEEREKKRQTKKNKFSTKNIKKILEDFMNEKKLPFSVNKKRPFLKIFAFLKNRIIKFI